MENFEQSHSAEKIKKGTFGFSTSILLQNIQKTEGEPFGDIEKFSRKVSQCRKKKGALCHILLSEL